MKDHTNFKLIAWVGLIGAVFFAVLAFLDTEAISNTELTLGMMIVAVLGMVGQLAEMVET